MSANPQPAEIEALLAIASRTGASTGAPVTALRVAHAGEAVDLVGHDILVVAPVAISQAMPDLFAGAPVQATGDQLRVVTASRLIDRAFTLFGPAAPALEKATGWENRAGAARDAQASLVSANTFSGYASWVSPADRGRVVVAVMASAPGDLPKLVYALDDPKLGAGVQGDLAVSNADGFSSFRVGPSFWMGALPAPVAALWWVHNHPLVLVLGVIVLALLLWLLISGALSARARRRVDFH